MAISEESRHNLYSRLEQLLGHDEATTLMEHLPPVGWADVATKRDLDHLGETLRLEIRATTAELRTEIASLGSALSVEMHTQTRVLFFSLAGLLVAAGGVAAAISRLL